MFPEKKKKKETQEGCEPNIQLSLGKSYLSLKIKASDSKQL